MSSVAGSVGDPQSRLKSYRLPTPPFSLSSIICVVVGYAPLLLMHFWSLWSKEQYQYFPFVIAAFGYLLYTRFQAGEPPVATQRSETLGRGCYVFAWVLLAAATLFQSAWLATVSLIVLLAGVLFTLSRIRKIQNLWGIWLLLWLLVPLPFDVDTRIVVRLQQISSGVSSAILDLLRVNHLMFGNVLQVPDKQFFVDEACSGIVSIMAVIACAAIYAVWLNRSPLHVALLIFAGVVWAISLNVARICVIAIAHAWWGADLSDGYPHDVLGFLLFTVTFIALTSSDQILYFLLRPITIAAVEEGRQKQNPFVAVWNGITQFGDPKKAAPNAVVNDHSSRPTALQPSSRTPASKLRVALPVAFVLLGMVSIVPIAFATQTRVWSVDHAHTVEQDFLPKQLAGLDFVNFESIHRPQQHELGDYSKTFTYRDPDSKLNYLISFDYPFSGGWHELCVCYKNIGWTLDKRKAQLPDASALDPDWPFVIGEFSRDNEFGYVAFSNLNADAEGLSPPTELIFFRPWRRLRRRMLKTISSQVFQVQVWVSSDQPIPSDVKDQVNETLLELREQFREHFRRT